jgi:type IV secretion system protein VirD4
MRIVVGSDRRGLVVADSQQAVLVLGPPRSGKTSGLVIPNVLAAWGPVLSTSTKVDVLSATLAARSQRGRCWLYDPTGTVAPPPGVTELRWSPVSGSAHWDGALLLARAIVGASRPAEMSHWTERAEALIAPMLHAAAIAGVDAPTVVGWINRRDGAPAAEVLGHEGTAADLLRGIMATDERELSGIWSTASSVLAAYRSDAARASSTAPNFDPAQFVGSGDTVYVCASGRHQDLVAPLVAGLISDIRTAAFARAVHGVDVPLLLALDEVANIAPIADLPALVSEGGGQGVLTLACLQDLSQGRQRWGAAAEGFGSLFGATVVLPGIGDVRSLEALSIRCGSHDVRVRSESRGSGRPPSRTVSTRRQRRVEPDQVSRGKPGKALLIAAGRAPAWTPITPWWRIPAWSRAARITARDPTPAWPRPPTSGRSR